MSERILLIGDMARDHALASCLDAEINVMGRHENPGLIDIAERTGGIYYKTPDLCDVEVSAALAVDVNATLAIVTGDAPLAAGTVDALRQARPDMRIVGPNKWFARLESDKAFARIITAEIDPSLNPIHVRAATPKGINSAIDYFIEKGIEVAIKPVGLAGGRGVKVMGKNLSSYDEAKNYAQDVLNLPTQNEVLIEEALSGVEFNLQIMTDGRIVINPPITIDYPYRDDGDTGPPTGGMGSISYKPNEVPSFMPSEIYDQAMDFAQKLIMEIQGYYDDEVSDGQRLNGVLYPNFMFTKDGLKLIEINVRPGDPEWMNIQNVIDPTVDMVNVLRQMADGELRKSDIRFQNLASAVIYFVPESYARGIGDKSIDFRLSKLALSEHRPVKVYFSSAEEQAGHYRTIGSSRPMAMAAKALSITDARRLILDAHLDAGPANLQFRYDVGKKEYLDSLLDPRKS